MGNEKSFSEFGQFFKKLQLVKEYLEIMDRLERLKEMGDKHKILEELAKKVKKLLSDLIKEV